MRLKKIEDRPPCLTCGRSPTDRDHVRTKGAGGKDDDFNIWYLCRLCHTEKHNIGLTRFAEKYTKAKEALINKGWVYEETIKRWIRIDNV